jgi:SAM-dependent methyltransferase
MSKSELPDSKYYQYISHIYHGVNYVSWHDYKPDLNFDYPDYDRKRFEQVLTDNANLIKGNRVLDLGCHSGFMLYVAHHLGATKITGVNGREPPLKAGKFFFDQLKIQVTLLQDQIENFPLIEKLCNEHDTVILTSVLEHVRNPEYLLSVISNSNIQNIIFEGHLAVDDNREPKLYYRIEDASWDFAGYNKGLPKVLASVSNRRFLEVILHYNKWKITKLSLHDEFNANWFATKDLSNPPSFRTTAMITAERFENDS